MKKQIMFPLLLFVLLLSACNNSDELSGKTFDVSYSGPHDKYYSEITLEFLDGNIVKNTKGYEEGTYDLKEDKLIIQFENENEFLEIEFTLEESNEDSSTYLAEINDADYKMTDTDKISHFQNFLFKLDEGRPYQFIEK
ncbi:hypothetical protein ACDX78_14345 [Virgibacillus oceani]